MNVLESNHVAQGMGWNETMWTTFPELVMPVRDTLHFFDIKPAEIFRMFSKMAVRVLVHFQSKR